MIYEYHCEKCGITVEKVRKVEQRNDPAYCTDCGKEMARVPSFSGGLKTEHPAWLDKHVIGAIQDPSDRRRITTRSEHDAYCAERGIMHK